MIKAGIIGGAGYTGGELIRLLVNHPEVSMRFVHSKSNAGNPVHKIHADLLGDTDLHFTGELDLNVDVLFLCAGHGEGMKFLQEVNIPEHIRIIDLSNDFRLKASSVIGDREFVYGLPELNRESIRKAKNIANPGCFATCIQLGLLPLAKAGLLEQVHVTGITGSTGAGQSLAQTSHFSWRANNIQAYKTLTHQHLGEIGESLTKLQPNSDIEVNFIPWRGDFTRGIFVSSLVTCEWKAEEKVGTKLVVHSITDNLLKGASGQAVQNMNLMFGIDETTGLQLKANYF
jgi:N-acetyl-gamma-glutamyl-phosphate reductase